MKRKIIKIDEMKCNGCGLCISGCSANVLKIIDGKARLVGELLCDGLGACLGQCPEGAITVETAKETYGEKQTG
ncbi:MAG: 4Fe-4S binding protein [Candidatus Omnitrophica bacterium]|nr:4Fe-4S binding protein [Candidatus Omnitrophota bacterium]